MGGLNTGLLSDIAGENRVAPEVGNPLGSYEQVLAVKQAQQQNALAPLRAQALQTQVDTGQLQAEAMRRQADMAAVDQADQQTWSKAFNDSNGDILQAQKLLGTPEYPIRRPGNLLDIQTKIAKAAEGRALSDVNASKARSERLDSLRGKIMGYLQLPDADKAAQWPAFLQEQKDNGLMTDQENQQYSTLHPTYPGDQAMGAYANGLRAGSQLDLQNYRNGLVGARQTTANSTAAKNQGAIDKNTREAIGVTLHAAATSGDPDTYGASYDSLTQKYGPLDPAIPKPEDFDADATPEIVLRYAATAGQQMRDQEAQRRAAQADTRLEIANKTLNKAGSPARLAQMAAQGDTTAQDALRILGDQAQRRIIEESESIQSRRKADPTFNGKLLGVTKTKDNAIARSQSTYQNDVRKAEAEAAKQKDASFNLDAAKAEALEDHRQRLQDAQNSYEEQITEATGADIPHNDWAEKWAPQAVAPAATPAVAPAATPLAVHPAPVVAPPPRQQAPNPAPAARPTPQVAPPQSTPQYQQIKTDTKGNKWGWSPGMTTWQQIKQTP